LPLFLYYFSSRSWAILSSPSSLSWYNTSPRTSLHLRSLRFSIPRLRALFLDKHTHVSTSMHANTNTLSQTHNTAGCDGNGCRVRRGSVCLVVRLHRPRRSNYCWCPLRCDGRENAHSEVATTEWREGTTRLA